MRARIPLAVLGVVALLAAACDPGEEVDLDDPDDPTVDDPEDEPDDPDDEADEVDPDALGGTLIAAIGGTPDQLDPHETTDEHAFTVLENVYDTLVQPAADLTMEPALAESWEVSDDLLTWTFELRDGVSFHDGSSFDADDVIASFEHISREEGPNAWRLGMIDDIVAVDEMTIEMQLNRPAPNLLEQIGPFKGLAIAPADAIEAGTLGDEPVGSGPFRITSIGADRIQLEAFDDYWGEGPHLDGLTFEVIEQPTEQLTALQTEQVHWIDSVPPQQVDAMEGDDQVVLERVPGNDYYYMSLNNEREPFDDPDVRRAIAFALNPADIAEAAFFDAAAPNETAIPEASFWYFDYEPFGHDPDTAEQLLADAGVDDLSIDLMVSGDHPETGTMADVIASQLGAVGVDVQIRTEDFTTWLSEQAEGNFDAFSLSWVLNIDPDDFYYAQHHSEGINNFQGFADGEVDELLDEARVEPDDDTRKELYDQAAQRIVDQASYIYFFNPERVQAWSPDLEGYELMPTNPRFHQARLAQ